MSMEPGITPDVLGRLGEIIDRDGLLDGKPRDPDTQRTSDDDSKPTEGKQESDDADDTDPDTSLLALLAEDDTEDDDAGADDADDDAAADDDADDDAGEGGDETEISTLAELAEDFEVEEAELLGSIMVDTGAGAQIPLGQVIDGYKRANVQMAAFRQDLEAGFQKAVSTKTEQLDNELKSLAATAKLMAEEAKADYESIDWEALKSADPDRYLQLRERRMRRDQVLRGAVEALDRNAAQRQQEAAADLKRAEIREADLLGQKRPDLVGDRAASEVFAKENLKALAHFGFEEPGKRLGAVIDHRELLILNAAAKYVSLLEKAKGKTLTKLRKNKGLRRPGMVNRRTARVERGDPKLEARKSHAKRLKKSGSVEDAAATIETFLKPVS